MGRPKKPKEAEAAKLTNELDIPVGTAAARAIQYRGPRQFRVQIRRKGLERKGIFESLEEAIKWRDEIEQLADGTYRPDFSGPQNALLKNVCEWAVNKVNGPPYPSDHIKNKCSHWRWWRDKSPFRDMALSSIKDVKLINWRQKVMIDDVGDDEADAAAAAAEVKKLEGGMPPSAQTVIHRLNALSDLYQQWRIEHEMPTEALHNPVGPKVRPKKDKGRNRRLDAERDAEGCDEFDRLLIAAENQERRPWLKHAISIAVGTALRQTELATLTWKQVRREGNEPIIYLPKTKNGTERTIPLRPEVLEALLELKDVVRPTELEKWRNSRKERGKPTDEDGVEAPWPEHKVLPVDTGRGIIHAWRDMIDDARTEVYEQALANGASEDTAAELMGSVFDDLRWHDLRHEAISRFFETTDFTETEMMGIVGHMSHDMLARYTHHRAGRLAAKMTKGDRKGIREGQGSIRLVVGAAPLVMNKDGKWVPLVDAEVLERSFAKVMLRDALNQLERIEAAEALNDSGDGADEEPV
jgi:integrase